MPTLVCPECKAPQTARPPAPGKPVVCLRCDHAWTPPMPKPPAPPTGAAAKARPAAGPVPLDFDDEDDAPRPKRSGPWVLAGVLGVLAVAAVGGLAVYLTNRPKPPKPEVVAAEPEEPAAPAAEVKPAATRELRPEQVYPLLLRSTVVVLTDGGHGSGVLVHRDRKLVLTNYHVVAGADSAAVLFPAYDARGELITAPAHYAGLRDAPAAVGKVVARDAGVDLALVELAALPDGVHPVALAEGPAKPGETVYSVGGSGAGPGPGGAYWRLSVGQVRGRHRDRIKFRTGQAVDAMLLETQKPVNPGDSGGPTVNGRGELVAVVSAGDPTADQVKLDIDLSEVRSYLAAHAKRDGWAWVDVPPAPPPLLAAEEVEALRLTLKGKDRPARVVAARRLGELKAAARPAVPDLLDAAPDLNADGRAAVAHALEQIGPPADADLNRLPAAAAAADPVPRVYALRTYAAHTASGADALPALVKALAADDRGERVLAAKAVARVGASARPLALPPLIDRLADPDPVVAEAAAAAIRAVGPLGAAEHTVFAGKLAHQAVAVRRFAAAQLVGSAATAKAAAALWKPVLEDADPGLRLAALAELAAWGAANRDWLADLLPLCRDDSAAVRARAVAVVAGCGADAAGVRAVAAAMDADADPAVREAAAGALAGLDLTRADLPLLQKLAAAGRAEAVRVAALGRIAKLGADGNPALDDLAAAASDPSVAVRRAAVGAFLAAGPEPARSVKLVTDLIAAAVPPPGRLTADERALRVEALDGLGRLGKPGVAALVELVKTDPPGGLRREVVAAVGKAGAAAEAAAPTLFALTAEPDWRAAATDALVRVGGPVVATRLIQFTEGQKVRRGAVLEPANPPATRLWAVVALGRLDPKTLAEKDATRVAERLRFVRTYEGEADIRDAATQALTRLGVPLK